MGISLDAPAKHPNMFVGQEFMNAIKTQVPVCPKCASRLAIGRDEELVCILHGPINKIDNNVRPTPSIPLKMRSLTPAPSCKNLIRGLDGKDRKCGASVMFVDDKWFCESCQKREQIERNKAELEKQAKDAVGVMDNSTLGNEAKEGLSVKDDTSSLKVKEDLHDVSTIVKQKEKYK